MIHRVNKCWGIPLWNRGGKYVELWLCLSGVKPHTHPGQSAEIIPLFGWSTFFRVTMEGEKQAVKITPRKWFHAFTIPEGWEHWFEGCPLIFLNVSDRCAATNLKYT